jgi:hypothetical protein
VSVKVAYAGELPIDISFKRAMIVKEQAKFHPVKYVQALAKRSKKLVAL